MLILLSGIFNFKKKLGPYGIWFASALIVVFLYYTVLRFVFSYVQDYLIQWRQKDFVVPFSNPNNVERQNKPRSWKEYIGNAVARLTYNRPTVRGSLYLTLFWFAIAFLWFNLAVTYKNKLWKMNEVRYFEIFIIPLSFLFYYFINFCFNNE